MQQTALRYALGATIILTAFVIMRHVWLTNPDMRPAIMSPSSHSSNEKPGHMTNCIDAIIDPNAISVFHQEDPYLLSYIRARHLTPPSKLEYNFDVYDKPSYPGGEPDIINAIRQNLKDVKGGFFVEVGAFDGIYSNTLSLETDGWSGLLIECNPVLIPIIRRVHRKAFFADVCLATGSHPAMTEMKSVNNHPASSYLVSAVEQSNNTSIIEVQSMPLYSILAAIGVKIVDVIVLDVQGVELGVLQNFPFHLILVKLWIVEIVLFNAEELKTINRIMTSNGYRNPQNLTYDYVYKHNALEI